MIFVAVGTKNNFFFFYIIFPKEGEWQNIAGKEYWPISKFKNGLNVFDDWRGICVKYKCIKSNNDFCQSCPTFPGIFPTQFTIFSKKSLTTDIKEKYKLPKTSKCLGMIVSHIVSSAYFQDCLDLEGVLLIFVKLEKM